MAKLKVPRLHLFEFTDLRWCPKFIRSMITDFLHVNIEKYQPYSYKIDLIIEAIKINESTQIIDLCSGNSGPWFHLKKQLEEKSNKAINVVFTDIYPSTLSIKKTKILNNFTYINNPIDARNVPKELNGPRTIFNGFHHFSPEDAQKIIDNCVENKQPIMIFELLSRNLSDVIIVSLFTPLYILLSMPFLMKPSFSNLFFTYIIPIFPVAFTWDAIVSHFRCYSEKELESMINKVDKKSEYQWEIGNYRAGNFPVTYFVAYPKESSKNKENN